MAIHAAKIMRITLQEMIGAPILADAGLVLLDLSMKPIAFDQGAAAVLSSPNQFNSSEQQICIPKEILNAIRDCKPHELAAIKMRFWAWEREYVCRVYVIPENGGLTQTILALHFERGVSAHDAVCKLSFIYGLTDRQREALLGLAIGLSNKEMARRMTISPNTVKVYLRLIMAKMGVTSRAEVAARLFEVTGDDEPEPTRSRAHTWPRSAATGII